MLGVEVVSSPEATYPQGMPSQRRQKLCALVTNVKDTVICWHGRRTPIIRSHPGKYSPKRHLEVKETAVGTGGIDHPDAQPAHASVVAQRKTADIRMFP